MAPANGRAFRKALDAGTIAPVYLLHGEDEFLKDAAVKQAIEALVDPATRDFNLELRRAADLDAETLGSLLETPPMMAERRVVVLRDVAGLRKDARRALDRYLERPAPDLVLLLVQAAGGKVDAKLAERASEVEFRPLTGEHLPQWIAHHAAELGGSIEPDAADLLVSAVGSELPTLASELEKLTAFAGDDAIAREHVSAVVGVRPGETMSDLLDAVLERNARRALALLPVVLAQPKASGVTLVMALSAQTLALAWARAVRAEGMGAGQLAKEFWTFLKSGPSFLGRPWGEAVAAWTRAYPRWTDAALDAALDALLDAELALKETTVSDEQQTLATCLLALCAADRDAGQPAPRGARRSAA